MTSKTEDGRLGKDKAGCMMNFRMVFLLFAPVLFIGCSNFENQTRHERFIKVYGKEDFSLFRNYTVFVRRGSILIWNHDKADSGFYALSFDDLKLREEDHKKRFIAKNTLIRLAQNFKKYDVAYLKVDAIGCVLVMVRYYDGENETTRLLRLPKSVKIEQYLLEHNLMHLKQVKNLGNGCYEYRDRLG